GCPVDHHTTGREQRRGYACRQLRADATQGFTPAVELVAAVLQSALEGVVLEIEDDAEVRDRRYGATLLPSGDGRCGVVMCETTKERMDHSKGMAPRAHRRHWERTY